MPPVLESFDKEGNVQVSLTHDQVFGAASSFSAQLKKFGSSGGKAESSSITVCLLMPTSHELVIALTALLWFPPAGRTVRVAPLNPKYSLKELEFYLTDLKPDICLLKSGFYSRDFCEGLGKHVTQIRELTLDSMLQHHDGVIKSFAGNDEVQFKSSPSNVFFLFHTSGTTGRPKLAQLSGDNINGSLKNYLQTYPLERGQKTLLVMPLFHVHGLFGALFPSLLSGVDVLFDGCDMVTFKIHSGIGLVRVLKKITWYTAVPTIHFKILEVVKDELLVKSSSSSESSSTFPRLKWIRSCSSPLPVSLGRALQEGFRVPILEAYAMTECAHMIMSNRIDDYSLGSVGRLTSSSSSSESSSSIRVSLKKDDGEVLVRGTNVMMTGYAKGAGGESSHYYVDPKTGERWFRTGDIGSITADGRLRLIGRSKEIIITSGEKVMPLEIDNFVLGHERLKPLVKDCVAFAMPHRTKNSVIWLALVLHENSDSHISVNTATETVRNAIQKDLVKFKWPENIVILRELPRTITGKVQRAQLTRMFSSKL